MKKFFNVGSRKLYDSNGSSYGNPTERVVVRRNDELTLLIGAYDDGDIENIDLGSAAAADIKALVKKKTGNQRYDEDALLECVDFTKVEIDGQPFYQATFAISGATLDGLLGIGTAVDVDEIEFGLQISLVYEGGRQTSETVPFWIQNNYERDSEAPAAGASKGSIPFLKTITDYTGGDPEDLDAYETIGRPVPFLAAFVQTTAGLVFYKLETITEEEAGGASPALILPLDYDADDNPKGWKVQTINASGSELSSPEDVGTSTPSIRLIPGHIEEYDYDNDSFFGYTIQVGTGNNPGGLHLGRLTATLGCDVGFAESHPLVIAISEDNYPTFNGYCLSNGRFYGTFVGPGAGILVDSDYVADDSVGDKTVPLSNYSPANLDDIDPRLTALSLAAAQCISRGQALTYSLAHRMTPNITL